MLGSLPLRRLARLAPAFGLAVALSACQSFSLFGSLSSEADGQVTKVAAKDKPIDVRHYMGPDYCPEMRVRSGAEVMRTYAAGHPGEQDFVIWQASVGKTARECLYDGQGGLTMKVGISGRVASGPKGGPGAVTLPLRIALVKYKEAILVNELDPVTVTVPPENAAVFNEVREIHAPSPGDARDFILFVGLDEKGEGLLEGKPIVTELPKPKPKPEVVAEVPQPKRRAPPRPQGQPQQSNVLPTPSSGFVLPGN